MAIPTFLCPDSDPDLCCDALYTTAEAIKDQVVLDLSVCMNTECGITLEGLVFVGRRMEIPYDSDYVAVSLINLGPSPGTRDRTSGKLLHGLLRATYQVRFVEAGYILAYGGDNDEPPVLTQPDDVNEMSLHAHSHAWAFYRSLLSMALDRQNGALGCLGGDCYTDVSALEPVEPGAGLVGWQANITTELQMSGVYCS